MSTPIEKLAHDAWWKSLKNGPVDALEDRALGVQKAWRCAAHAVRDDALEECARMIMEDLRETTQEGAEAMAATFRALKTSEGPK